MCPARFEYPINPQSRFGHTLPSHPGLARILNQNRDNYSKLLSSFLQFLPKFREIPRLGDALDEFITMRDELIEINNASKTRELTKEELSLVTSYLERRNKFVDSGSPVPIWINGFLGSLDSISLYGMLATVKPQHYLEIGSGFSTKFARRCIQDNNLSTKIISVDPEPRADIDTLCDQVIRTTLEDADLSIFNVLKENDIVFFDGSHVALPNSDVTVFFLEVLPYLPKGCYFHVHDILLPDDYTADLCEKLYSEQYLIATALLARCTAWEIILPNYFITRDSSLMAILDPIWNDELLTGIEKNGSSFWGRVI